MNGNVGIGTTTPAVKLHVAGNIRLDDGNNHNIISGGINGAGSIIFRDNNFGGMTFGTTERYQWQISGATKMVMDNSGNVGIGTTTPGAALDISGNLKVSGNFYAPGTIAQVVVNTSEVISSLATAVFTEPNSAYRITITPKFANSKILVEYNFSINTAMGANVINHMQLVRNIGGSETLVGIGPVNGSRNRTSFVTRPSNGYDANDMQNVYMVAQDTGLTAGTAYTYGFKYRNEASGICYFNYSSGDSGVYGFSGVMTMKATEIAQ